MSRKTELQELIKENDNRLFDLENKIGDLEAQSAKWQAELDRIEAEEQRTTVEALNDEKQEQRHIQNLIEIRYGGNPETISEWWVK